MGGKDHFGAIPLSAEFDQTKMTIGLGEHTGADLDKTESGKDSHWVAPK
jgi:hypothetical protein